MSVAATAASDFAGVANPRGDIRAGLVITVLFFVGLVGWASFARLDAAAHAHRTLVVSGQRKSVQHRDGGVIGGILVAEGERVTRGQLLIQLAAPEVRAQERALSSQVIDLTAQRARLRAEQLDIPMIAPPAEFASLEGEDRHEAALALKLQQAELKARLATVSAQRDALRQRAAQSHQQGLGYGEQAVSAQVQLHILDEQINSLRPVADKGFVSQTRMRELERLRADMQGRRGQYAASIAETQEAARESQIQRLEAERTFRERTVSELRGVEMQLGEALPKLAAAREQLAQTQIRAPVTGAIVALAVFTPGGVISPGQRLMDIVPERTPLTIQARFPLGDADDLHVGQHALVRFPTLHERGLPNLDGTLTRLSADSLTDDKTGQSYFTGDVTIPDGQLRRLETQRGRDFHVRAGMAVELLVPLHKRTALEYALEPLTGAFWTSFREH